jgi:hypothetical protein
MQHGLRDVASSSRGESFGNTSGQATADHGEDSSTHSSAEERSDDGGGGGGSGWLYIALRVEAELALVQLALPPAAMMRWWGGVGDTGGGGGGGGAAATLLPPAARLNGTSVFDTAASAPPSYFAAVVGLESAQVTSRDGAADSDWVRDAAVTVVGASIARSSDDIQSQRAQAEVELCVKECACTNPHRCHDRPGLAPGCLSGAAFAPPSSSPPAPFFIVFTSRFVQRFGGCTAPAIGVAHRRYMGWQCHTRLAALARAAQLLLSGLGLHHPWAARAVLHLGLALLEGWGVPPNLCSAGPTPPSTPDDGRSGEGADQADRAERGGLRAAEQLAARCIRRAYVGLRGGLGRADPQSLRALCQVRAGRLWRRFLVG